ncbi:hypothetical protein QCA50_008566 [Cerrena zonata]|uniref:Phosphoglycerate mutase-like protein n=1 Tax=Cerrena zonata TaxID=2478898 RepID=A0AAW0G5X1_9APHY
MSNYTAVVGFFLQSDPVANGSPVALLPRFGLEDHSEDCWKQFRFKIDNLNSLAPLGTKYKVLFLGRHGEGYHNAGLRKYGHEEWMRFYSLTDGDDEMTWAPDAQLTPLGHSQAAAAREAWRTESSRGIMIPQKFYVSPRRRALETWTGTFGGTRDYSLFPEEGPTVTIVENCRETYGIYPCDMRLPLSVLQKTYPPPTYQFEVNFTEHDPLWTRDERETDEHVQERAKRVLDVIFKGPEIYVSITAHGWFIRGLLAETRHQPYRIPTGGVLPVVIKQVVTPEEASSRNII